MEPRGEKDRSLRDKGGNRKSGIGGGALPSIYPFVMASMANST